LPVREWEGKIRGVAFGWKNHQALDEGRILMGKEEMG